MAGLGTNFRPVLKKNDWELQRLPMKESVAMEEGAVLYSDLAGEHTISTGAETNQVGILAEAIASTDADYATAKKMKYVYVMKSVSAECYFTVGAGTFNNADVGKVVALNNSLGLAVDTAGTRARITRYISATRGLCILNLVMSQT